MARKTLKTGLLAAIICCTAAMADDPNDCIEQGRAYMFDGTLSGLRLAYQTFDDCLNDPTCPDCDTNRELKFLHALARTTMLVVRDDDGSINSVFELAKEYGVQFMGDNWAPYLEPLTLRANIPLDEHDAYAMPDGAPDAEELRLIIDASMIPEIEAAIADLNSISDTPGDPFRIFFDPNETRIFSDRLTPGLTHSVEVDYGEVLILKGLLTALKGQLQAQAAHDFYTDPNDMIAEKMFGDAFNINNDLLDPYPDFMTVLPTAQFPDTNGADLLDQARQGLIEAIDCYFEMIDYLKAETDPQEDDLLYLYPDHTYAVDEISRNRLTILRDSLVNKTPATFPDETTKTYNLYKGPNLIGELELVWDLSGTEGSGLRLSFSDPCIAPANWEIECFGISNGDDFWVELENFDSGWRAAYLDAKLAPDGNSFDAGTFVYMNPVWNWVALPEISGQLAETTIAEATLDLNPLFGASPPVNLRDLLPQFDQWNGPIAGTMGHGLGDDPTLGGIFPDMDHDQWQRSFEPLQPSGLIAIAPGTPTIDGDTSEWTAAQLVLDDAAGDTDDPPNTVQGVDVDKLYLAYDADGLYCALTFYDDFNNVNYYRHELSLNYTPDSDGLLDLEVWIEMNGSPRFELYQKNYDCGYPCWSRVAVLTDAAVGLNAIEFKIPFADIPGGSQALPGRFISFESGGWNPISQEWNEDYNYTHLRIEELDASSGIGAITGNITYADYSDAPIFVQACTDVWNPEDTLVGSTMITAPGAYTIEGIGDGWSGYIRAFTPLFGFNLFDLDALTVEEWVPVSISTRTGVDLVLNNPALLTVGSPANGEIYTDYDQDWYAFDAVQHKTYQLDLVRGTSAYASMTLYGRNGHTEIEELHYWQPQRITWTCPTTGTYYVKAGLDPYYLPGSGIGTYQIQLSLVSMWVDVKLLADAWLRDDCEEPDWCNSADFDRLGSVNFVDFCLMATQWLTGDPGAPDGMVWVSINDPGVPGHEGFTGYMNKYETTNAQYCQYLNSAINDGLITVYSNRVYAASDTSHSHVYFETYDASSYSQITYSGGLFSVRTRDGYDMSDYPVVEVSWYGATAFCN